MFIKEMCEADWPAVAKIYEEGIATGNATFETSAPGWKQWNDSHIKNCRFVAVENDDIIGWAALSFVSDRCAYVGVAENSIYIAAGAMGKGIGKKLLLKLIEESENAGFWTLHTGIFPENIASIKLHEKCGYHIIGKRERIGKLNGIWRDTLLLERRSKKVGIN